MPLIVQTRRMKAFVLATPGEKEAAIAEVHAIQAMGDAFAYLLRRELEREPLRGEAKVQQLMKEAEARADAQPRPKKPGAVADPPSCVESSPRRRISAPALLSNRPQLGR